MLNTFYFSLLGYLSTNIDLIAAEVYLISLGAFYLFLRAFIIFFVTLVPL